MPYTPGRHPVAIGVQAFRSIFGVENRSKIN
jgi:hypothetical protein